MAALLRWGCGASSTFVILACVCLSLITLQSCGAIHSIVTAGPGTDYDPGSGGPATCENAGLAYSDNPFRGWPQQGRGWSDINYYYCAANYEVLFDRTHWGIDIEAYHREPLFATATATVVRADYDLVYGMGKNIKVCTPSGWCATYMHLDEWVVSPGQSVNPGDLLGYADNTGFSTGTHLHYQINNPAGQPVDPAPTLNIPPIALGENQP